MNALLVNWRSETTLPAWWNGRITRLGRVVDEARREQALNAVDDPPAGGVAREHAEGHALGPERRGLTGPDRVADGAGDPRSSAAPASRCSRSRTCPSVLRELPSVSSVIGRPRSSAVPFIRKPSGARFIVAKSKRCAMHEHVGDDVAAAAGDAERHVVAAGAGVGVRRRHAVEVARKHERIACDRPARRRCPSPAAGRRLPAPSSSR